MTHHIPNPIVLDPGLPFCRPYGGCPRASGCASYLVAGRGRPLRDYTASVAGWSANSCPGWRDVSQHRPDPASPTPTTHEAPKGLL